MTRPSATVRILTAAGAVIVAALVAVPATAADRLPDKDVKALLERIDNERWRLAFPRGCRKGRASLGVLEDDISNSVYGLQDSTGRTISLAATSHSFTAGLAVVW